MRLSTVCWIVAGKASEEIAKTAGLVSLCQLQQWLERVLDVVDGAGRTPPGDMAGVYVN